MNKNEKHSWNGGNADGHVIANLSFIDESIMYSEVTKYHITS